jgi:segregation and condensation protein B
MEEQDPHEVGIRPDEPLAVEEPIPEAEGGLLTEIVPPLGDTPLRAAIEALVYVAEEPLTVAQLANVLGQPAARIQELVSQVAAELEKPEHGVAIREVAGGYKMATKAEHHEAVRAFAKSLKPPLKLSLAALETLAVIAYKQPVTVPEIQEIRGVQGAGVVKTLLDRKLVAMAGRKNVIGKPILYKTSRDFLIQFGLKDLSELPSLKEFEEIRRIAFADGDPEAPSGTGPVAVPAVDETHGAPLSDVRGSDGPDEAMAAEVGGAGEPDQAPLSDVGGPDAPVEPSVSDARGPDEPPESGPPEEES